MPASEGLLAPVFFALRVMNVIPVVVGGAGTRSAELSRPVTIGPFCSMVEEFGLSWLVGKGSSSGWPLTAEYCWVDEGIECDC